MFIQTSHGILNAAHVLLFRRLDTQTAVAIYRPGETLRHAICSASEVELVTGCTLPECESDDSEGT